jgi:hypothetical protein
MKPRRTLRFVPGQDCALEPRLALDGDLAAADDAPGWVMAPGDMPNGEYAFQPYTVPEEIEATTDDSGTEAGIIGSSFTGMVSPIFPPTAIAPTDPY